MNAAHLFNNLNAIVDYFDMPFVAEQSRGCVDTNIIETDKTISIFVSLPGTKKEDVKIRLDKNWLLVKGKRSSEYVQLPEKGVFLTKEFSPAEYGKKIRIPVNVSEENVVADLNDGILKIVLNKSEEAIPKEITIN